MSQAKTEAAYQIDPGCDMHEPALYRPARTAAYVERWDDITPDEVQFYGEQGYLAVRHAFTSEEIASSLAGLTDLIMGRRPDFHGIHFEAKAKAVLSTLDSEQRQDAVRKLADFVGYDSRLHALAHHPALLQAVRRLLGGREPALFQDMALIKPPRLGREKPWHQDLAYFDFPLGTPVLGVWIALDEATIENGCMQVMAGMHRSGPMLHFQRRDWQICDHEMLGRTSVAVPLPPGGALFFDALLPHGTPHNASPRRRRALQFHYAPVDARRDAKEQRLKVFGAEGKNVTC